jgi:putative membrane protein
MKRLTLVLLLLGVAVLCGLVLHIGPSVLAGEIQKLGVNLCWVLLPSVASYVFDALGWRYTLGRHADKIRFDRLFMTRMAGEAVNYTTPGMYLGGEPMKAYLLSRHQVPLVDGMASVVTAKTTMTLAEILFIMIGIGLSVVLLVHSGDLLMPSLVGLGLLGFGVGLFVAVQRRGLFMGMLRVLERLGVRIAWLQAREHKLQALDDAIRDFYVRDRRGFMFSFLAFFTGWLVGAVEVYLILYFLGLPVDWPTAIALEALAVFAKGGTAFIPGSVGGQEAGTVLLFVAFGYTEAAGVTFAIVRRIREILWIAFGLWALGMQNRSLSPPEPCDRPPLARP